MTPVERIQLPVPGHAGSPTKGIEEIVKPKSYHSSHLSGFFRSAHTPERIASGLVLMPSASGRTTPQKQPPMMCTPSTPAGGRGTH